MSAKHPFSKHIPSPLTNKRLADATETAQATAMTIAIRWPEFVYDTMDPTHKMSAETRRAFTEKAAVAMEAGLVATQAWQRLWIDMAFGRVQAKELPQKIMHIADTSSAPARRRVKANARRLTAQRLKGK
ncbi:hypothetical protein [Pseudochelatococcus contaminans]|uniref:Uncharacterized protein n=1 Tax=Pseudochelatococcus contaminans TaxID=1538103 RepID=A0A7W5Z1S1_9HYPH|nr:hypothetical protein [Pseudochelatococcus contaminans]MBB3808394.1 hypothetical protein [Pseudochelatococcus contaminans]